MNCGCLSGTKRKGTKRRRVDWCKRFAAVNRLFVAVNRRLSKVARKTKKLLTKWENIQDKCVDQRLARRRR